MAARESLERLIRKRAGLRASTTKLLNKMERELGESEVNINKIEECLNQLASKESILTELDRDIENVTEDLDELEKEMQLAQDYMDNIILWKTRANRFMAIKGNTSENHSANIPDQGKSVKLPKLNLESFDGDVRGWQNFWSQYDATIHQNSNLTKTEKFSYLKTYLSGSAANAISGLAISDLNYDSAVNILMERFGRKDLIVNAHMNKLLNLHPVRRSTDVKALRELYDDCETQVRSLDSMGVVTRTYGSLLCPILLKLIPDDLGLEFSRRRDDDADWDVSELLLFLRKEVESRERAAMLTTSKPGNSEERLYEHSRAKKPMYRKGIYHSVPSTSALNVVTPIGKCIFCNKTDHSAEHCINRTVMEKRNILQRDRRCFICLKLRHIAKYCRFRDTACAKCNRRSHHVCICTKDDTDRSASKAESAVVSSVTRNKCQSSVALQTLQVIAEGPGNISKPVRALLDGGSQRSFITQEVSQALNLTVVGEETLSIYTFGNNSPEEVTRKKVKVTLKNILNPEQKMDIEVLECPSISSAIISVPSEKVCALLQDKGIELSDTRTNTDRSDIVSLLVGSDVYWRIVTGKTERLGESLVALESKLGWTIQGSSLVSNLTLEGSNIFMNKVCTEDQTSNELQKFWDLESLGIKEEKSKENEDDTLKVFESNLKYENQRYQVSLPWKEEFPNIPNNFELAKTRLKCLCNKFKRDFPFYERYNAEITEQLKEGIVEEVPKEEEESEHQLIHYVPHHAVIREDKSTKLRIVYDASARETGKPSLNECLHKGPNLNPDILEILLKFRTHRIGFMADIRRAFLQVQIAKQDRDAVRFLWIKKYQFNPEETELRHLRMTRVPFGTSPSPFLLAATIRHHLGKYKGEYPRTCELLDKCLYVDDLISGAEDSNEVLEIKEEAIYILSKASMELTKWSCSSPNIQRTFQDGVHKESNIFNCDSTDTLKVLGLSWNILSDEFVFDIRAVMEFMVNRKNTKRCVLQTAARIYDPVGFLSPYVIRIKCIFQELWQLGVEWDSELPTEQKEKWDQWCWELRDVQEISVPRWYFRENWERGERQEIQFHVFTDASERSFGAVVFLRYITRNGEARTAFVSSKSRVAPLKKLTLPRLELTAALIGARLIKYITSCMKFCYTIFMWADSQVTLHWIKGDARRWKPFVQNRVQEIQTITAPERWFYCPSKENPADLITRGQAVEKLASNGLWWTGPLWLTLSETEWPRQKIKEQKNPELNYELRTRYLDSVQLNCVIKKPEEAILELQKFSSLIRVTRITCWVKRFCNNCRKNAVKCKGPLSTEEQFEAQIYWIGLAQIEGFREDYKILITRNSVDHASKLRNLNPFFDNYGLMCIKGRLQESELGTKEKEPWLLPYGHRYTELVVKDSHERLMHSGVSDTLAQIRETFWIVKGRKLVKTIIQRCPVCKRFSVKPGQQEVAPLPRDRITESPPFCTTGMDFAGPLYIRNEKKYEKAYILLCTCAITRAVHLELVPNLSTFTFMLAFRRFVARRGICTTIYSDNSQTFRRADKDLQSMWKNLDKSEIQNYFSKNGVQWKYIVPKAPWYGGFYERLVRTVKMCLKKVLGKTSLTFDEMTTTITEVEAILNSRPLTYTYEDAKEPVPLTPGHFLTGQRITAVPCGKSQRNLDATQGSRTEIIKRLKYRNVILNHFWKRWRREYLLDLRSANQAAVNKRSSEIKEGDIVLIHDEKLPRQMWKMGRIMEVYYGRDKRVRSCAVMLPTKTILKRPIQLLYNLEIK